MKIGSIQFWGDSIFKGIVFDEIRGRYVILKKSAARLIGEAFNIPIINNSLMGRTAPEGLEALRLQEEPLDNTLVLIEYGGNDCDFNWEEVAAQPNREHLPNTTLAQFSESLKQTVELVRRRGGLPIFCTLPPLDAVRYFEWISRGLSKEGILKYLGEVP
ncbi:MAG: SGNH/GDSL hydrolase family protein, partial [Clostridiales bacterium]|nr:SGNH/GDSL hydrolase family protein [Clostridiales bacterium]